MRAERASKGKICLQAEGLAGARPCGENKFNMFRD